MSMELAGCCWCCSSMWNISISFLCILQRIHQVLRLVSGSGMGQAMGDTFVIAHVQQGATWSFWTHILWILSKSLWSLGPRCVFCVIPQQCWHMGDISISMYLFLPRATSFFLLQFWPMAKRWEQPCPHWFHNWFWVPQRPSFELKMRN